MASAMFTAPCGVRSAEGADCQNYVGLRPNTGLKFNASVTVKTAMNARRLFAVRASEKRDESIKKLGMTDAECEAAVVAGNAPDAPPVPPKPASPAGTPVVSSLPLSRRPRRNRRTPAMRASFQETNLSPGNFVYPLFIHEGEEDTPIGAMPGCYRLGWRHGLIEEVGKARDVGVNSVVLFPKVPDALKVIYTDVALDPYSSDGHDGIVREDGVILNDETVHQLCKQAVSQVASIKAFGIVVLSSLFNIFGMLYEENF
ncbi:hypothetical protein CRG98_012751 [Punica granatum]|uniref:porphobilinogen synthase n=1 Tax=Punica granatum TaxID=22663 RepID=A0A2I0KEE8_PUNGR|nr:hypothetical protein CRG98_012751 [Punica granatum]